MARRVQLTRHSLRFQFDQTCSPVWRIRSSSCRRYIAQLGRRDPRPRPEAQTSRYGCRGAEDRVRQQDSRLRSLKRSAASCPTVSR